MSVKDSYTSGIDSQSPVYWYGAQYNWHAQTFKPTSSYTCSYVQLSLYRTGVPGNTIVSLRATTAGKPSGVDLATCTKDLSAITTDSSGEIVDFVFDTSLALVSGTTYAIVLQSPTTEATYVRWRMDISSSTYTNGSYIISTNAGVDWTIDTATDFYFVTNDGAYLQPLDKTYTKYQVAFGGNEVWWESTAGTLAELTAANGDIDTSKKLTAIDAYQKIFITNETDLKVIDWVNTKIATADVGANPPDVGTVLTSNGTGSPTMVVDYITALSSACTIYGKRTTTVTFGASETVTGTDDDGNAISFAMTAAAEVAPPHWYTYTVYGADAAGYGALPTFAHLITRYRGRIVLSGNKYYPHQWYMSRVAKPFDFLFTLDDPLTGLAGNNIDAGEIGDIVTALVPYGDDYMIMGAANSIHLIDGDPGYGGSIDEVDNTTGIFSQHSWCKDAKGNLYFWGTNGIYKMEGGRSRPVCISEGSLPALVKDWNVSAGTHRIVFIYDPFEHGIIISKTTLADGTNLNYFFDLKTQGFYPETYPTTGAIFCGNMYDSASSTTRGLVVGCFDGYIRRFNPASKNDDTTSSTAVISSYVTLEMLDMNTNDDNGQGKLTSLTIVLGGGAAGGTFGDSDAVSYDIHVANDAETCLEDIKDGATPHTTGTLTGPGRFRIRPRIRGKWVGIRLYNATASETFVLNKIAGNFRPAGRI